VLTEELQPIPNARVLFTCGGSEAIDSAIKLVRAGHKAAGDGGRSVFLSRHYSYHGVMLGGTSAGGLPANRDPFGTLLPDFYQVGRDSLEAMREAVAYYGPERIAAIMAEPVIGAGGVFPPPPGYLQGLRELCEECGALLVFDEVITGFGRTGQAFAAQSFGVTPDMITMAKALTNGAQPMSAVAVSERIHDTISGAAAEGAIEFFHGYTYSGHPAACAAGLATLDIYRNDGLFERGRALSPYFQDAIFSLRDLPAVADIRGYGMLAAIDVHAAGASGVRGHALQKKLFDNGLNLKTTGDCALIAPPLIAEKQHIDMITDVLRRTIAVI
jgi:beta-alanine--pyruvate transaminase